MNIRPGKVEESDALQSLVASAFLDYVRGVGREWPGPYDWMEDRLSAGEIFVAEEEGTLLGMMAISQDRDESKLTLDLLAVDPNLQGKGIGRALAAEAEDMARCAGYKTMHLHTVAKYEHLVKLYESLGFEVTHTGPRLKGDDGFPRAFMKKALNTKENSQ